MGNPFKKITNTSNKHKKEVKTVRESAGAETRKCENCGAARPKDTNLTTCDYCGFRFMTIDNEIKTDK